MPKWANLGSVKLMSNNLLIKTIGLRTNISKLELTKLFYYALKFLTYGSSLDCITVIND